MALRRLGYEGCQTGHGFQHIASTILNEHGFDENHIESQLSHKKEGCRAFTTKPCTQTPAAAFGTRKPRELKTYKNPHTGEVVGTKGGNHETLQEWKTKYGADQVEAG